MLIEENKILKIAGFDCYYYTDNTPTTRKGKKYLKLFLLLLFNHLKLLLLLLFNHLKIIIIIII